MTTRRIGVLAAFILLAVSLSPAQIANGIALQKVVPGNWAQVVPNATVTVCTSAGTGNPCTPLATIYTDRTLTTPAPNPFNADTYGNYTIYAPTGVYVVCVAGTQGLCQTIQIGTSVSVTGTANQIVVSAGVVSLANPGITPGFWDFALTPQTVATLPAAATNTGRVYRVTDAQNTSDCTTGTGTTSSVCYSNGTIWTALGSGLLDPGSNGIVKRTAVNTTTVADAADVIGLFTACSGTQYLGADGACHTSSGATLQTNGVNNIDQSTLNIQNSTVNTVGLTNTCSNPSVGNVKCEIGGTSYTGNAATATNVAFSGLTGSTNSAAAMVVGTGSSLGTSGSGTIAATSVPYNGVTTGSNLIAKTEGTSGSLVPVNIGQVAGSQVWVPTSPVTILVQANFTATLTGGSISSSQTLVWAYTVSSAAGESLPSQVFSMGSAVLTALGCSSGSACTITLLAPTIPAGYTSWTAYSCNTSTGPCTAPVKVATCANLAAGNNCTLTAPVTTGTAEPTVNTAFIQPTNVQASDCPPSITPTAFVQTNDLNYHTAGGMDTRTANNNTGVFTWCRQMFFSDLGNVGSSFVSASDPVSYNNAMIAFNHDHSLYNQAAQNRMLAGFSGTPTSFAGTLYAAELMQFEMDKNCNGCTINGSPDGEFTLGSFQLQDNSATTATTSLGTNVLRLQYFKAGAGQDNNGMNLVNGIFSLNNTTATASILAGYRFKVVPATSTTVNTTSAAFLSQMQNTATLSSGQIGFYNFIAPAGGNNGVNFVLRNDSSGIPSWINGTAWVTGLSMIANGTLPITGSATVTGSVTVAQATGPNAGSASCTGGASQYTYELVGVDSNGGQVPGNPINTPSTCVNPLTSGNPATISFNITSMPSSIEAQFVRIDIYRTAGPMATGKIGTLTCTSTTVQVSCSAFSDTGLSASGTVPTLNTTGSASAYKYITSTNCAAVGSAANPSIAACGSASAGAFSCDVAASGGTCTVNTTAVTANSEIFVQEVASEGARLTVTCNTSPTVIPAITLASKVAATSFTINMPTITANPACFVFYVIN